MPDVAKLKKKAAEFELKKQFDKALAAYVEILDSYSRKSDDEVDLSLYNRVGDLFLKQGNVADAVDYYEQAVDRYAEGGFFNNAIALCNKILRNSPGRASVYYKLGKISAQKGFKGDAKVNFLEYADRMQQAGKIDESFRALKEFADLCPDQDDIRLMLADQLTKKGRGPEAVEQLQTLYERYTQEGRDTEARATVERMKAIDPAIEPRAGGHVPRPVAGDLVFLDLNDSSNGPRSSTARRAVAGLDLIATGEQPTLRPTPMPPTAVTAAPPRPAGAVPAFLDPEPAADADADGELEAEPDIELEMLDVDVGRETVSALETQAPIDLSPAVDPSTPDADEDIEPIELQMYEPDATEGMTRSVDFDRGADPGNSTGLLEGLETTSFGAAPADTGPSLLDLVPSSFAPPPPSSRAPAAPVTPPPAPPPAELGEDLLDFEIPDQRTAGPREVAPREVLRSPEPYVAPPVPARPSFDDLPMLDDGPSFAEESTIGGDLELIMPDDEVSERDVAAARRRTPPSRSPVDDIPLMDLDLPLRGEAMNGITGPASAVPSADDLEMIDLAAPVFELDPEPEAEREPAVAQPEIVEAAAVELSPAELDVRADLVLDDAPIVQSASDSLEFVDLASSAPAEPEVREPTVEVDEIPAPPRRSSTMMAAHSVEVLRAEVELSPDDHSLRRRLGEAMLESGDREGGMRELEAAMVGYERYDDLSAAASLADEIVLLNPSSVRHHQKRVEYAFRTNERGRLIEAYLQLADALFRAEQVEKSRAIYQRVLDLSPDDSRANAALQSFPDPEPAPAPVAPPKGRTTTAVPRAAAPLKPITRGDDEFVNLGDWLRDDEAPKDTRMIVEEKEPTGDEEADFQDMLRKFKQGIAENVEEEDHQSHYDLGVAFKEMGLLDEAIAEFQKALRGPANRVSTYEALGQCFIEKAQYPIAATVLQRALHEQGVTDDQLVGVLYLLGLCAEQRGQRDQAVEYYQRVFVVDIQFRDVGERLAAVESTR